MSEMQDYEITALVHVANQEQADEAAENFHLSVCSRWLVLRHYASPTLAEGIYQITVIVTAPADQVYPSSHTLLRAAFATRHPTDSIAVRTKAKGKRWQRV